MPKVLLVEDEAAIADAIVYALASEGFEVEHCALGSQVAPKIRAGGIDAVLLDVGLPDASGFDVCRELRTFSDIPVLFLTARNAEVDRVLGLELGADDYVAKPFSPRELVARVRARLRRARTDAQSGWRRVGAFEIDPDGHRVRYHARPLELTRYELGLLMALLQRPGAVLTRAQLLDRAWDDAESSDRTIDTHVKTLRAKLRAISADTDPIRTHRGIGYSMAV